MTTSPIPTPPTATDSPAAADGRPYFWQRFTDDRRPDGQSLAALRRGIDREPGSVPAMWPYYTTLTEGGHLTPALAAEHLALTLFAVHQQSRNQLMHHPGIGLGKAVLRLKRSGKYSADAVDRRFSAAATATSLTELGLHMRGLLTQLRGLGQQVDYTQLTRDLRDWHYPDRVPTVRRRWGSQYFAPPPTKDAETPGPPAQP